MLYNVLSLLGPYVVNVCIYIYMCVPVDMYIYHYLFVYYHYHYLSVYYHYHYHHYHYHHYHYLSIIIIYIYIYIIQQLESLMPLATGPWQEDHRHCGSHRRHGKIYLEKAWIYPLVI